ncbi:MAG: hypothetical protein PWQ57_2541 [Desulfovibrionales bacterium]|jgi:lysophospholipid acyltransferase (LPLAT)-like uncharacterized protein|nr:hypothetical protein [Desulfovibrionales bacterium]
MKIADADLENTLVIGDGGKYGNSMSKTQRIGAMLAPAAAAIYRLWARTLRYPCENWESVQKAADEGRHIVFVLWHDELFALPGYGLRRGWRCVTIVSQSKDGEVLARVLQNLGLTTARGSSSRGGVRALVSAYREMRDGRRAVITVDGPRGPRHEVKDGPIFLAHKAKARIVPVRVRIHGLRYVFKNAWDRFQIPYPFSTCSILFGKPYDVQAETLDQDALAVERARLQKALDDLGEELGLD